MSSRLAYFPTRLETSAVRSGQEETGSETSIRARSSGRSSASSRASSSARRCGESAPSPVALLQEVENALDHSFEAVDTAARDSRPKPEDIAPIGDIPRDNGVRAVEKSQRLRDGDVSRRRVSRDCAHAMYARSRQELFSSSRERLDPMRRWSARGGGGTG